jgi:hypothetical protein
MKFLTHSQKAAHVDASKEMLQFLGESEANHFGEITTGEES